MRILGLDASFTQLQQLPNMAIQVVEFSSGGTKLERFLHKNQHTQRKFLNFESWTNGESQQLAKIRVCKVDYFILPLFLMPKLRSVTQNEWKKHQYIYIFSTFGSKINKFEWKKLEKKN